MPTIIRWPGFTKAGSTSHEPVVSYDYAPTLAETAGVTGLRWTQPHRRAAARATFGSRFYNLKDDLGESKDLSAAQPVKAAAMRRRLEAWLRDTGAQIPQPNPNYDPAREREEGEPSGPVTAK